MVAIIGGLALTSFCYAEAEKAEKAEKAGAKAAGKVAVDKEAAVPAEGKNVAKGVAKDAKAGAAKEKDGEKKAEKPVGKLLPEQLDGIKKLFPKLVELRDKVDEAQEQIDGIKDISDPKVRAKEEKKIPLLQRKLESLTAKLAKEYEKEAKPYEEQWTKLKDQDEKLGEKIAALEAKKKDATKPWNERGNIEKQLTRIDQIRTGLATISTPGEDEEKK